jgi:hypothetical protein
MRNALARSISKMFGFVLCALIVDAAECARAQTTGASLPPPAHLTSEQDHQRLLDLLHISSLRPGADGDPKSAHAANYDETSASHYAKLPDPLLLNHGQKVTSVKAWWKKRRAEIVEDFDRDVYGRMPNHTPKVNWEVISTTRERNGGVPVITKKLVGHVDNSAYPLVTVNLDLTMTTPANANGPVPLIMEFSWSPEVLAALAKRFPQASVSGSELTWQQQVLAKGWGYAIYASYERTGGPGRGTDRGRDRAGQSRATSQARRLGRTAGLGLGRQPRSRLF